MNWYLTKLVFNIEIEKSKSSSQFDEQLRMISATSQEEAFFKARAVGKREEVEFLNTQQKKIAWRFIDVCEVQLIEALNDGVEIYSSTHETEEANNYIRFIKQKASLIQTQNLVFI